MRYRLLLTGWLISDLIVFISSYALAYFLRVGWILSTDFPFEPYITVVAITSLLWLVVLITTRTFALTRTQGSIRNLAYIIYSSLVGTALFALGYYFLYGLFFSRMLLLYALVISTVAIWIWHLVFARFQRFMLRRDPPVFPTLIVGVTRESRELIEKLNKGSNPLKPVAVLDGRGCKDTEINGVPVRGKLNKLEDVLSEGITHLIQCSDLEQSLNLLSACRQKKITYMLLPSVLGIVERDEKVESLEGQPVTMVGPKENALMWFFK
jgi:FlaA1/EpsC-like NDP-sugar epimerase